MNQFSAEDYPFSFSHSILEGKPVEVRKQFGINFRFFDERAEDLKIRASLQAWTYDAEDGDKPRALALQGQIIVVTRKPDYLIATCAQLEGIVKLALEKFHTEKFEAGEDERAFEYCGGALILTLHRIVKHEREVAQERPQPAPAFRAKFQSAIASAVK